MRLFGFDASSSGQWRLDVEEFESAFQLFQFDSGYVEHSELQYCNVPNAPRPQLWD